VKNQLPWQAEQLTGPPVVSVILFCKNAAKTVRRSVESICAQTFRDFEYVVQDAGSTDGTLEIIESYSNRLDIRIVSEPDLGPADGFWKALRRCKGSVVATCLADEELLPDALEHAARIFGERPYIGALTGDAYNTDASGRLLSIHKSAPFSLSRYLAAEYCPYWSSSFFSMRALRSVGLFDHRWSSDSLEFEIWCRLAEDYEIAYVPKVFSKYSVHMGQLSNQGERALAELGSRLQIMRDHVFRPDGVYGHEAEHWREPCALLQQVNLFEHLLPYGGPALSSLKQQILANPALPAFLAARRRDLARGIGNGSSETVANRQHGNPIVRAAWTALLLMYRVVVPLSLRARISPARKSRLKRLLRIPRTP